MREDFRIYQRRFNNKSRTAPEQILIQSPFVRISTGLIVRHKSISNSILF